ncbi:rab9 effector protein with kelch motifs [Megalobrama amblycephala]|uniref:rab9 effector protein with kelch motifs n=1 Tax=Megalobrama amblycephala TaxID=75352 RepID=UPI0020144679|nr:rab9 effector protein with kelch motifs [Megalobrama amblycephala]
MELLPVLDPEEKLRDRLWYVVVATGAAPGVSVGHTCTFLPSSDGGKGRIVVVGGANPDGSFSDSHMINLDSHEWEIPEWAGLQARYEHCSFVPESDPQSLWVFAGAEKSGNRNCVQVLRMSDGLWKTVQVKGSPPTVRTYHTNSACVGNRLYVFSGGDAGAAPVTDPQVHVFDSVTATWTQPQSTGKPPAPRHGHVIAAIGSDIYIHGGMSGETFHNDMFLLNTETMKWEKVKAKGEIPPGVAAHSSVSFGKNIFIFGGMTSEGASNSMFKFQCDKQRWTRLKFEGDLPPGRLDHSMCLVPWRVKTAGRETCDADVQHLCFIFGGMDTQGVIFNDCLVTLLT